MKKDYYDILGVPQNTSKEDIKRAYHILAHQFHPDKNKGNEKRFKEINEAYRILSGDKSRAQYDLNYKPLSNTESEREDKNKSDSQNSDKPVNNDSMTVSVNSSKTFWVLIQKNSPAFRPGSMRYNINNDPKHKKITQRQ